MDVLFLICFTFFQSHLYVLSSVSKNRQKEMGIFHTSPYSSNVGTLTTPKSIICMDHEWPFYPDLDHFIFGTNYMLSSVSKRFQFILINCEINLMSSYLIIGFLKNRFEPKYWELSVCIEICLHESSKGMIHENWCTSKYQKFFSFWSVLPKQTKKNVTKYSIIFFCNFGA